MTDKVSAGRAAPAPVPRAVGVWLLAVALLVIAMVLLGGATRLTQSGLSMVDWHPVSGVLPPFGEAAWETEFERYKQYPEYRKLNRGMSLGAFKSIYWFEFSHRILGRLIGLAFFVPFIWFVFRRQIGAGLSLQLLGVFLLGGLQGLVGWWMGKVKKQK